MKTKISTPPLLFILLIFVLSQVSVQSIAQDVKILGESQMFYYGAQINGVTAGYGETVITDIKYNNKKMILLNENVVWK